MHRTKNTSRSSRLRSARPVDNVVPIAARWEPNPVPQRVRARQVILNAALRLYGREGYAAVTMRALAEEIGCSAAGIYTHFLDKNEIFSSLQQEGLRLIAETITAETSNDPLESLRETFHRYYEFGKAYPEYFMLLWVDRSAPRVSLSDPNLRATAAAGDRRAQHCLDKGLFPPALKARTIAQVLWSTVHGAAVIRQLGNRQEFDVIAATSLDAAIRGLRASAQSSSRPRQPRSKKSPRP